MFKEGFVPSQLASVVHVTGDQKGNLTSITYRFVSEMITNNKPLGRMITVNGYLCIDVEILNPYLAWEQLLLKSFIILSNKNMNI